MYNYETYIQPLSNCISILLFLVLFNSSNVITVVTEAIFVYYI